MRTILIIYFLSALSFLSAQRVAENTWWFYFSHKNNNTFSVDKPQDFLSHRSIERRAWQSVPVTERDLPVTIEYIDSLASMDLEIKHISKWLNGVLVISENQTLIDTLHQISFMDTLPWVPDPTLEYYPEPSLDQRFSPPLESAPNFKYGDSEDQIKIMSLDYLHNRGYTGKGVLIAVLDGGFMDMPSLPAFKEPFANNQVLATRNFVDKSKDVYGDHPHGTYVTSIIAGRIADTLIGTAPDASILLATTENVFSETRIEEYAWIEGAEWADSLGADIINTSLGYTTFDDTTTNYLYSDMDGKTAHISIANSITSSMGIVSVTSAGNEGDGKWHYIGAPADAENILAVGAVNKDGVIAGFSSRGPSADRRIKPDISAMGAGTTFQALSGIARGNGTSFSSPLIAGAAASLWQAYPSMHAEELMDWIIVASSLYDDPDIGYGFGIPSFAKAFHNITSMPAQTESDSDELIVYPNPVSETIHLKIKEAYSGIYRMTIFDLQGRIILSMSVDVPGVFAIPEHIQPGMYILQLSDKHRTINTRIIRN